MPRLGAHLGFAAGLGAQPMWRAVELLGHHTQELCLVLTAIVVGGADVHQLKGQSGGRKVTGQVGGKWGWARRISTLIKIPTYMLISLFHSGPSLAYQRTPLD